MRTLNIEQHYGQLGIWERIRLLFAAEQRGDEVERRRLFDASPMQSMTFSEHLFSEMALSVAALMYITEQLESASWHFFAQMLLREGHIKDEDLKYDLAAMAGTQAYCFVVKAQGWRRFCQSLDIDPDALIAGNHKGIMIQTCEKQMERFVPPTEELAEWFKYKGFESGPFITAESEYESWRRLIEKATTNPPCFDAPRTP